MSAIQSSAEENAVACQDTHSHRDSGAFSGYKYYESCDLDEGGVFAQAATSLPHKIWSEKLCRRPLLVLDLNGTLIHRSRSSRCYTARPHLGEFLTRVMNHYAVLFWSSARPENVKRMAEFCFDHIDFYIQALLYAQRVEEKRSNDPTYGEIPLLRRWRKANDSADTLDILSKVRDTVPDGENNAVPLFPNPHKKIRHEDTLAALWHRGSFGLSRDQYFSNPVTVKDLNRVWGWRSCWHEGNTFIIDDSPEKVVQKENWIPVDTFANQSSQKDDTLLLHLASYLESIANQPDLRDASRNMPFEMYDEIRDTSIAERILKMRTR